MSYPKYYHLNQLMNVLLITGNADCMQNYVTTTLPLLTVLDVLSIIPFK